MAVLSVTFLFRVSEINITKSSLKYSNDEILIAVGIKTDDNLLFLNSEEIGTLVAEKLPYIKSIEIKKSLPSKIEILCEDTEKEICISVAGNYYAADGDGKILEKLNAPDEELPIFEISENATITVGRIIEIENEIESELLVKYLNFVETSRYMVNKVNITDTGDSFMEIDKRLLVQMGTVNYFDLKTAHLNSMLEKMSETAYGTVDLTSWSPKKHEAFFTSSEPTE